MMLMDALAKTKAAPGLELIQVERPVPRDDEVLIKIRKTAICGTDLHIYKWDAWSQKHIEPTRVIGHEYVGEIAELSDRVMIMSNGKLSPLPGGVRNIDQISAATFASGTGAPA